MRDAVGERAEVIDEVLLAELRRERRNGHHRVAPGLLGRDGEAERLLRALRPDGREHRPATRDELHQHLRE